MNDKLSSQTPTVKSNWMDDDTLDFAVHLFGAFASPTRLRVVELLTDGEKTVGDIASVLCLSQSGASSHLAILDRAGVVTALRRGTAHYYRLRGPRIVTILRLVSEFRSVHRDAIDNSTQFSPED